jgi:hypothetical protein
MWLRHHLIRRFLFNLAVLNCSGVSVGMGIRQIQGGITSDMGILQQRP